MRASHFSAQRTEPSIREPAASPAPAFLLAPYIQKAKVLGALRACLNRVDGQEVGGSGFPGLSEVEKGG